MIGDQGDNLKTYLDLAGVIIVALNKEGNITLLNKKGYEILGYKEGELNGKNWFETCLPKYRKEEVSRVFKELIRGEFKPVEFHQNPVLTSSGEERIISWHNAPLYDADGNVIGTLSSGEDITELIKMKEELEQKVVERTKELKESEDKYRSLTDQSEIGIFIIQDNQIKYINNTAAEILGYTCEEVENWIFDDYTKFIHPKDKAFMLEQALKKQKGEEDVINEYDFRFFNKNGEMIWGHNISKAITYEGKPADFVTQIYITERKEMEQKLKESEEKLKKSEWEKKTILKSISELIVFQDLNNTIIWANQAAADSLNMELKELIGQKCFELWTKRTEICEVCPIKEAIKTGLQQSNEITTPDGKVWFIKGFPVKDEEGTIIGAVEVTSEITKLKEAENKVNQAYQRMNLYRTLFAHDIYNIFTNIKMASELCDPYLNDPNNLNKLKELHQIIEEQIIRGDKLIKNVQKLTSLEDTKFPLRKENLRQILNNSIEFLNNSFPNRDITSNIEIGKGKFFVNANELLLDAFENILFNAVKHNKKPQIEIDITVSKNQIEEMKFVKLEFKDNAKGISDKRKQIIFLRGKTKSNKEGGLGLGLSLVKVIIDSYEGKIWVEDRIKGDYKKGSNFVVLIPEA